MGSVVMVGNIDVDVRDSRRVEVNDPRMEGRSDGPREETGLGAVS